MRTIYACILAIALLLLFSCRISYAVMIVHEGLPNKEGVKPDPLSPTLSNPNLPNRKGVKIDPAIVHAAFKTEGQFDTNVFLENENEKFDYLTILTPEAGLELSFGDNKFSVDSETEINLFSIHKDHSYVDERLRGVLEINWTDYKIFITDVYKYFSDRSGSEDVRRVKRQNNFFRVGGAALFEQLEFDVGYTFGVEDYLCSDVIFFGSGGRTITYQDKDRFLNIFGANISYRFLPKTSLLIESYLGFIDYHTNKCSDSWFTETLLGLQGDLRENFTSSLSVGFRYQKYDESEMTDSNDFVGPVVRGGLTYSATKDDKFDLLLERGVFESTFNNMNYYIINHAGLRYTHFFSRKLSLGSFGYYQLNLYPSDATINDVIKARRDHLYGAGAVLRYDIKEWISCELNYEHRNRRSTFGTFNYNDDLVTISATVGF
ncbi:MAG: outer membrane beta-barrel protein [Candidatus Omnitrophota bacterium]|nr:outer membrane beta-barrel protein [Candidatus Omnitrophota bacterium]